jgi:hypothetical protein
MTSDRGDGGGADGAAAAGRAYGSIEIELRQINVDAGE